MAISGVMFVISIPMIALSHGYSPLVLGRLLQGTSAGLIGVVVPLYLAECLTAANRGKGTGIFQWLLTAGIAMAALIGLLFSFRLDSISKLADASAIFAFKNSAWRGIFWVSLPPGISVRDRKSHVVGIPPLAAEARKERAAYAAFCVRARRNRQISNSARCRTPRCPIIPPIPRGVKARDSLFRRKYVIPFVLACVILACNQTTGINSIIAYNTNILLQSGLSDLAAHMWIRHFHLCEFLCNSRGCRFSGSQRAAISAGDRYCRNHCVDGVHWRAL